VNEPGAQPPLQANYATQQTDGNFVLYNASNSALWATNTAGTNAQSIMMQDDGNLVLYVFKWSAGVYAAPSLGPFQPQTCGEQGVFSCRRRPPCQPVPCLSAWPIYSLYGASPANCADNAQIGNLMDVTYGFNLSVGNNGNVMQFTNNRTSARSLSFAYDSLKRLPTAQTAYTSGTNCFGEGFGYDSWGNLLSIGGLSGYASVMRHLDCTISRVRRARVTFSKISQALAVQTNGLGWRLWSAMYSSIAWINSATL
jgi:hypothetical protein